MKILWIVLGLIALLVVVWLIARAIDSSNVPVGDSLTPTTTETQSSTITPSPSITGTPQVYGVSMENISFNPQNLRIDAGETIIFTNNDTVSHTVTSNAFDSGTIEPGQVYNLKLQTPGTYNYYCKLHPQMTGIITVN